MPRKIFFSFHYERDAWRAGQVRNCDLIPNEDEYGFVDAAQWESIKRQGDEAIKRWIKDQMGNTSVTVVLVGAETSERPWVLYEIEASWNRGNGIVGVSIHNVKDSERKTDVKGQSPFDQFELPGGLLLSSVCKTYDWATEDGRNSLGSWTEEAFVTRRRFGADDAVSRVGELPVGAVKARVTSSPARVSFTPKSPWSPGDAD